MGGLIETVVLDRVLFVKNLHFDYVEKPSMDQIPLTGRLAINFWRSINIFGRKKSFCNFLWKTECHFRRWTGCCYSKNLPKLNSTKPVGIDTRGHSKFGSKTSARNAFDVHSTYWGLLLYTDSAVPRTTLGGNRVIRYLAQMCCCCYPKLCLFKPLIASGSTDKANFIFTQPVSEQFQINMFSGFSLPPYTKAWKKHLRRAVIENRSSFSASDCLWRVKIWAR